MPIITMKRIAREDLTNNPEVLYLFGDNDRREGYGGQAAEMRDEENAVGVRTKWAPGRRPGDYFSDVDKDQIVDMLDDDLQPVRDHLENGGLVVVPADGLGTGLSQLPEKAPAVFAYLEQKLEELRAI